MPLLGVQIVECADADLGHQRRHQRQMLLLGGRQWRQRAHPLLIHEPVGARGVAVMGRCAGLNNRLGRSRLCRNIR